MEIYDFVFLVGSFLQMQFSVNATKQIQKLWYAGYQERMINLTTAMKWVVLQLITFYTGSRNEKTYN